MTVQKIEGWLAAHDVSALADWEVSDLLNAPCAEADAVVALAPTPIGIGDLLGAIGLDNGGVFLDALASGSSARRYLYAAFDAGRVDVGSEHIRAALDGLVGEGILSASDAATLKRIGERRSRPSWAQRHGVEVTPRAVGIARGGKP